MVADKPARAANIFDVARLAGVSHQTVSRVLNGLPNVRPATKERVEQAIVQLRYSPSPAARALVTKRTRTIGLVTPSVADYGPTSIALHFNLAARAARYSVDTVSTVGGSPEDVRQTMEALLRQRVDAIVMVATDAAVVDMVKGIDLSGPVVASGSSSRRSPQLVSIDQYRGARSAVRHLVEIGHRRILHVAGPANAADAIERIRGWRDELQVHGLEATEPVHGDWSAASGYAAAMKLAVEPDSAVFVGNDQMAIGLVSGLRERHLNVPQDVSVVGFDDIPEAGFLHPPLTTIRQDFAALGQMMMQKVLVALEESDVATTDTPLPTHVILRASTQPPGSHK